MSRFAFLLACLAASTTAADDAVQNGILLEPGEEMKLASALSSVIVEWPDASEMGDVEDVVLSHDGRVVALVVGVGGIAGLGERNVAIAYDLCRVKSVHEGIRYVCDIDRVVLDAAPTFEPGG